MIKPFVDNSKYRMQEVDLQPYGNTISVECPSDNPFEDAQDINIVTQANGDASLSGAADPRMKSKRILTQGKRLAPVMAGRANTRRVVAAANAPLKYNGFIPGLGALTRNKTRHPAINAPRRATTAHLPTPHMVAGGPRHMNYAKFIPGMGSLGDPATTFDPTANTGFNMATTPPAGQAPNSALTALTSVVNAAGNAVSASQQAKIATAQAAKSTADAAATQADTERMAFMASLTKKSNLPLLIGGAALAAVALYFLTRPKKAVRA